MLNSQTRKESVNHQRSAECIMTNDSILFLFFSDVFRLLPVDDVFSCCWQQMVRGRGVESSTSD